MKVLTRRLEELDGRDSLDETLADLIDIKRHLNMDMEKEERYWEQLARVNWLKTGDRNTSFFHNYVSQRRCRNHIWGLKREDGVLVFDH